MRRTLTVFLALGVTALALVIAGCGDDEGTTTVTVTAAANGTSEGGDRGTVIDVEVGEESGSKYFIRPAQNTVEAGTVTFAVTNVGQLYHEFIVYANAEGIDPGDLEVDKETNEAVLVEDEIVGEAPYATPPIVPADKKPGDADHRIRSEGWGAELTVALKPGKYILLCNLEGHYASQQFSEFTAE